MKNRRILLLSFLLTILSASAPGLRAQESGGRDIPAGIAAYAEQVREQWKIPGLSLAVIHGDSTVFSGGFGVREKGRSVAKDGPGVAVTDSTLFHIGSMTKAFTATVIASLVDEELLSWEDTVKNILPDFDWYDDSVEAVMQVRDLLTHSTGLVAQAGTYIPNLGYDRDDIYRMFRYIEPVYPFREKFAYNGDMDYLRNTAYPIMKSAAEFCFDWLIDDGQGHLITSPSTSPEHRFIDEDGKAWAVTRGATMDLALIRNLFENTIQAIDTLQIDQEFGKSLANALDKMLPYQIGAEGDLNEWMEDYADAEPSHRHVSHLFCLHPGNDISANQTPELFEACKKTLLKRGDNGTGWSLAWKVCFWARLLDGEHAYKLVNNYLNYTTERGFSENGGTYPNLFNACPPFQIDGNFGIVEGISEMLLQSHLHEIHLLPALPAAWQQGTITGLKARGGYDIDMTWNQGQLAKAIIHSHNTTTCHLRTNQPVKIEGVNVQTIEQKSPAGTTYLHIFNVEGGKQYTVKTQ